MAAVTKYSHSLHHFFVSHHQIFSESSKLKTWPILGAFVGQLNNTPFLIGCYVGR